MAGIDIIRRNTLEVDLGAVAANYRTLCSAVAPLSVIPVLKANAYGLGALPIARCLAQAGAPLVAVADPEEAMELDSIRLSKLILGDLIPEEIPLIVDRGYIAPVGSVEKARLLSAEAIRQGRVQEVHVKIDSGMGRLGIPLQHASAAFEQLLPLPGINISGLYSHFPHAYGDIPFSRMQVAGVLALAEQLRAGGLALPWLHIANSDGIQNIPEACQPPFSAVRTGINLYGVFDLEGAQRLPLAEVLTLSSRLISVRQLPAGHSIGYGRQHHLQRSTLVGTIAAGYADGVPVALSHCGRVLIRGVACPVIGRVSMDYTTVDLSACAQAQAGDTAVLLGDGIPVAEWAARKGTITYEIICSIGHRVRRLYRQD